MVYGISMVLINPEFTLYIFIMLPIYFLSSYFYFKKQSNEFVAMEEKEGEMTNVDSKRAWNRDQQSNY